MKGLRIKKCIGLDQSYILTSFSKFRLYLDDNYSISFSVCTSIYDAIPPPDQLILNARMWLMHPFVEHVHNSWRRWMKALGE